jgi:hypothetical protein
MASTSFCIVTISRRGTPLYHRTYATAFPLENLINISSNLTIIQITKTHSRTSTELLRIFKTRSLEVV